ncbi:SDR family oxidoreductase [Muricoccus radiodurans]|uniref:SDR family oxidoreductase n=1 Tax=Muricoccus radiodurans TaxID=2231721 RepID=UPI003CF91BC9
MPEIRNAVVVIAGASSGIGRAAAQVFARHGARLVLAGRSKETLDSVVAECTRLSADAIAVPTDVSDSAAVQRLVWAATGRFGRIDVWINNAGVGAVGPFESVPAEAHAQVVHTNLIGEMNGAHAVLPVFKRQGHGILINTISMGAWVPAPFAVSYSASKFGLRGFSEALRAELQDWPGIHVCDVFPGMVDTPGLRHGANYTGHRIAAGGPILSPFQVAEAMLSLARRPRGAVTIGLDAWALRIAHAIAPAPLRWAAARVMGRALSRAPRAALSDGNLFTAPQDHAIYGGFRRDARPRIPRAAWMTAAGIIGFWLARRR